MLAEPDRTFGNRGALWSTIPTRYVNPIAGREETHHVGGTAEGVHVLPDGSVCLVVWAIEYAEPWEYVPTGPKIPTAKVLLVRFPRDGAPREYLRGDGTNAFELSEPGRDAAPLAGCALPDGSIAVVLRQAPKPPGRAGTWSYTIVRFRSDGQLDRTPIASFQLFDPSGQPRLGQVQGGGVRMAVDGSDARVASAIDTRVRLSGVGAGPTTTDLAGSPALPGLVRIDVASLRFESGTASIAMTAHLNHPGVGPTSVAAVLRIQPDGHPDPAFAANGLWASPLGVDYRGFVTAGEAAGLVAGHVGERAVVFALDPSDAGGSGLDASFAGGMAEHDLGGPLSASVMGVTNDAVYVFAQRVPARGSGQADLRTASSRFRIAPFTPQHGTVDLQWGIGGTSTISADGAPVTPVAIAIDGPRIVLAATRQLPGVDLDRIPIAVVLDSANGAPVTTFGAPGFALHGSVRQPALIDPDGSATFVERTTNACRPSPATAPPFVPALRLISSAGNVGRLVPLSALPPGATVSSLTRLPGGHLLLSGAAPEPWLLKLDANGAVDAGFGNGGFVNPRPGSGAGSARVLGIRPDGDIAIRIDTIASELAVIHPDGTVDTSYGSSGYVGISAFTHPNAGPNGADCFLDADGSVVLVVSNSHEPGKDDVASPFVRVGLRRVSAAGAYDPQFGLGAPGVLPSDPAHLQRLERPQGGTGGDAEFSAVTPAGIAWMGGRLYVVATGWSGGRWIVQPGFNYRLPVYPLLLLLGWQADGTTDSAWNAGHQEAGYDPNHLLWSAAGVLQDSPTTLWVYGQAGQGETVTSSLPDGSTWTTTIVRQPQPALFRVEHPGGFDPVFGGDGAVRMRLQELLLSPVAGALVGGKVRVACVDVLQQPTTYRPQTNLGGLVQWSVRRRRRPARPLPPVP